MDQTAKRVVSADRNKEGRHGPEELFPMSSPFTSSAPAARVSGGARPSRPSMPPSKKKRRLLFVPPPPRTTAINATTIGGSSTIDDLLPRQEEPCPGGSPIFDWSLNAMTEDPMVSGSEPYIDMLTQDVDADLQLLMQSTSSSRRGSNFSRSEDIQLCNSWMNVSNDPVVGTDQPRTTFWQRVANDFHQNKDFESDRTANSLEHRCTTIIKDCMQFHGYYEDIQRQRPRGVPHQEHLIAAQARYAGTNKGKSFQFIHCWLKIIHCWFKQRKS